MWPFNKKVKDDTRLRLERIEEDIEGICQTLRILRKSSAVYCAPVDGSISDLYNEVNHIRDALASLKVSSEMTSRSVGRLFQIVNKSSE